MKKFIPFLLEESCPVATQDIHVNLENRQHAIDEYYYGPANPNEPGNYWKDAAKRWKIDEATAKTMKCGNCAAFDASPKMLKCIESGIVNDVKHVDGEKTVDLAELGYCNLFHFKCAASRSCTAWLVNGPIK